MASQLRNSGMQNLFGGASNLFGAGAAATTPDFNSALASGGGYGGGSKGGRIWVQLLSTFRNHCQRRQGYKSGLGYQGN